MQYMNIFWTLNNFLPVPYLKIIDSFPSIYKNLFTFSPRKNWSRKRITTLLKNSHFPTKLNICIHMPAWTPDQDFKSQIKLSRTPWIHKQLFSDREALVVLHSSFHPDSKACKCQPPWQMDCWMEDLLH